MAKTKRVSKRRYSRRKTTRKHSKKIYRNKNRRKTRRANRTKKRMMGGASRQETFKPTHTINNKDTPLRKDDPDSVFVSISADDELLPKNTKVYVVPIKDIKYSMNGFIHHKVKLEDNREGYIRVDYLSPIPSQTPAPAPRRSTNQSKVLGEPGMMGETNNSRIEPGFFGWLGGV